MLAVDQVAQIVTSHLIFGELLPFAAEYSSGVLLHELAIQRTAAGVFVQQRLGDGRGDGGEISGGHGLFVYPVYYNGPIRLIVRKHPFFGMYLL